MYTLNITVQAKKDIANLKKNGGKAVTNKIEKLLTELIQHPKIGTGQVEQLKGNRQGQWSRRIDKKNRLIIKTFPKSFVYLYVVCNEAKQHKLNLKL